MRRTIQRLRAQVRLDDPQRALADAAAQADGGDEDWRQWLAEYRVGDALVVRIEVWVDFETDRPHLLRVHNHGVWVETTIDPPKLEAQIAEIVDKDFDLLSDRLRAHGLDCDPSDLAAMYVHVELGEDVLRALRSGRPRRAEPHDGVPHIDASVSRQHGGTVDR